MRIVFLDFDGVIRVPLLGEESHQTEFCQGRMKALASVAKESGARIVVSSDWRNFGNRKVIEGHLAPYLAEYLHEDWATPICGHRWNEIERWLSRHPEVTGYAILDDFAQHFEGCPDAMRARLLLCTNRYGLVPPLTMRIPELLARPLSP